MSKKRREIPVFELPIIETHCHLDYLKEVELSELLSKSLAHNIEKIMTISVSPKNLQTVIDIANSHENIFCTQGIHPHDANEWTDEVENTIRKNIDNEKVKAVGEIGLDFYYNKSEKQKQIDAFKKQLQIAIDFDKPVVIHSRDADDEMMEVLKEYAPKMKKKGVIHSFTSTKELALCALDLGFYLGFNGIITFKNAEDVRETLRVCPIDRILLETDAPFLTPVPYRGRENAPYYLPFIAEEVAKVKELKLEIVLKTCYQNSKDCLSL